MTESEIIELDGNSLTPDMLYELSKGGKQMKIKDSAWKRINDARNVIDQILIQKKIVYGVNTGFGNFANTIISEQDLIQLQKNLIRSHAAGVGCPLSLNLTRMLLALRVNVLAKGYSGISQATLNRYIEAFNKDILSYIPEKGTVGASGDLAPLSHLALGLMGEGKVWDDETQQYVESMIVLTKKNFQPIQLREKEGLALINGTQFMTAIGTEALIRAERITISSDIVAAMTFESQIGHTDMFSKSLSKIQQQLGQIDVQDRLRSLLLEDGQISQLNKELRNQDQNCTCRKLQDSNSIMCIPQVHGIAHDTLKFVRQILTEEINSATDNPLVFLSSDHESFTEDKMMSGGNFHGEYPSKVFDYMCIAMNEIGSISDRRIERLINPILSNLPAFLVKSKGINSGFMIPQVTAAALASENKTLSHPASIDTITTSANQEDHVSMGGWSSRKALKLVKNVEYIVAIELMAACQTFDLLRPLKSTTKLENIFTKIREFVPYLETDYVFTDYIETIANYLSDGQLLQFLK